MSRQVVMMMACGFVQLAVILFLIVENHRLVGTVQRSTSQLDSAIAQIDADAGQLERCMAVVRGLRGQ